MPELTNAQLRTFLPAGITLSPAEYPDTGSAVVAVAKIMQALFDAQSEANATNTDGTPLRTVTTAQGALTNFEYPPESGTVVQVMPRIYQLSILERHSVTETYPGQL